MKILLIFGNDTVWLEAYGDYVGAEVRKGGTGDSNTVYIKMTPQQVTKLAEALLLIVKEEQ